MFAWFDAVLWKDFIVQFPPLPIFRSAKLSKTLNTPWRRVAFDESAIRRGISRLLVLDLKNDVYYEEPEVDEVDEICSFLQRILKG